MSYTENNPNLEALKIVVGETVVGTGYLEDGVIHGELSSDWMKCAFPSYDPTAGLSIAAETPERAYVLPENNALPESMGFERNENVPYPAQKKGTFDA